MMKNYDQSVEINQDGLGSGKTNVLLNLIKHQRTDIDKLLYMSKIHSNQSINCLFIKEKK